MYLSIWNLFKDGRGREFSPELLAQNNHSLWFLNLLSNQALGAKEATKAWGDRRFKNHWLQTRVVCIQFNQDDKL